LFRLESIDDLMKTLSKNQEKIGNFKKEEGEEKFAALF
jgi:hypothetical protein